MRVLVLLLHLYSRSIVVICVGDVPALRSNLICAYSSLLGE